MTIPVEITKVFKATRRPGIPIGTKGEIVDFEGDYAIVRFALPLVDVDGAQWGSHGENGEFMELSFLLEEVKTID